MKHHSHHLYNIEYEITILEITSRVLKHLESKIFAEGVYIIFTKNIIDRGRVIESLLKKLDY